MAMIKLLEYTFDNSIDADCLPTFVGVGTTEVVDEVSGNITKRIINVEESGLPTQISFNGKKALLTLEYANTSNVTNMQYMFNGCSSLTSLDVSNWNTSNVTNMAGTFTSCPLLRELDLSNFDTSKVVNMSLMFRMSSGLIKLDLSNFNLSNVTDTSFMFYGCNQLTNIGLLYSPSSTINTIASLLPTSTSKNIYYLDAIPSELTPVNNVNFIEYKSNTISTNEVVLRSLPNGVCDTLDLETGEYVQSIGEVVLDGSEIWSNYFNSETNISFISGKIDNSINKQHDSSNLVCDKLIASGYGAWSKDYNITLNTKSFSICLPKTVVSDIESFKQWLSQNPITIQYELATPIITTIDLKQHPFAYKDGYVVLTSSSEEVSLTPTIEYSLIANRLGQIQSNQKLVEKQQAQIVELESMVIANLVNTQYQQALNEIKLGVK